MSDDPLGIQSSRGHPRLDGPLIKSVRVRRLFGRYNYDIHISNSTSPSRIILLYGDNGCGKTTILTLLWHLLSPAPDRAHRTGIARTPFGELSVDLSNGDTIHARKLGHLKGDYEITVMRDGSALLKRQYLTDREMKVPLSGVNYAAVDAYYDEEDEEVLLIDPEQPEIIPERELYIDYLKALDISPFFLADDRRVYSDQFSDDIYTHIANKPQSGRLQGEIRRSDLAEELSVALARTGDWLDTQVIEGTAQGSQSADGIYLEVLSQLVGTSHSPTDTPSLEEVERRIKELDERTKKFDEFGLVPHVSSEPFLQLLHQAKTSMLLPIGDILTPYLDGQRARLDSLQHIQSLIRTFVDTANSFLKDKQISYAYGDGLDVIDINEDMLEPNQLSSGERQFLVLMCHALLSRDGSRLFLIDEPELSLNAKWQRKLIDALLACVESSNVQFLMATHSIEIITGQRPFLVRLRNKVMAKGHE